MIRQPVAPVGIARGNPLTNSLRACWLPIFGGARVPEITTRAFAAGTSTSEGTFAGVAGRGVKFSGASSYVDGGSSAANLVSSGSISVLAIIVPAVLTRGDLVTKWRIGTDGASSEQFNLLYGLTSGKPQMFISSGTAHSNSGVGSTAMVAGNPYHVGGTGQSGTSVSVYLNGKREAQNTTSIVSMSSGSSQSYRLGNNVFADGQYSGSMYLAAVWDRLLSDGEFAELYRNPWQLFAPISARVYSFPSGEEIPPPDTTSTPVGSPRRRRYIIGDNPIRLTNDELEAKLASMLRDDPPPPKVVKRAIREARPEDKTLVAAVPNFAAINAQLLAKAEFEAAQRLREIAKRMADDEDEREVEMLLWG